jgi:ammonium transporter, Amt family
MLKISMLMLLSLVALVEPAYADPDTSSHIDKGNTAWMIVASALVMLMTPGLGFFYSGMVGSNNAVATIMHSYMKLCLISLVWLICGYSLAFGPSVGGFVGNLDLIGFKGIGLSSDHLESNIPHILFATFQGLFAVITTAIITGSFAERVKLGPILVFSTIWVIIVYAPVAHWVWGGGWIEKLGALDFAGGAVVHINSGVAGLVAALYLGSRKKISGNKTNSSPHNLPLSILGGALLWFGWFGFNAGSALAADELAGLAFANTNIAAAAGAIGWYALENINNERATSLGIISGSVAGLVAITPAAGFVTPISALVIGLGGGFICYWSVCVLKPKMGYDDSLDAFGLHGIGGIWGAIATGIFATTSVNSSATNGLIYGNPSLVGIQIASIIAVICYSATLTYCILLVVEKFVSIRVSENEEKEGLDISQHGERGYKFNIKNTIE